MENHQKQRKMKSQMKNNEVANEKKWNCKWKNEVWWQKVMNENEKNEVANEKMIFKFTQQNDMKIQMIMKMKKICLMVSECSSKNLTTSNHCKFQHMQSWRASHPLNLGLMAIFNCIDNLNKLTGHLHCNRARKEFNCIYKLSGKCDVTACSEHIFLSLVLFTLAKNIP